MKDIFKCIINAQVASDGGKNITTLKNYNQNIFNKGYKSKDREILRALNLINSGQGYDVKYSVIRDYFSNNLGKYVYIVYFTFHLNGERLQISFHCFNNSLEKYVCKHNTHKTRWDRKSSRDNVIKLLKYYNKEV